MKIQDVNQFKATLRGFLSSQKTQRDNLQDCLLYAFDQYGQHSNCVPLTDIITGLNAVKTVPSKTVKEYIKAHANVKLVTDPKDKSLKFKKDGKGDAIVKDVLVTWYDWHGNNINQAKADITDPVALLRAAMVKIKEAIDAGKIVEGREDIARDWLARLDDVGRYEPMTAKQLKALSVATATE